jgi:antitoxin (DNA-binding transcriptional repressor) of toxin-antitoxin stability system
MTSITIRDLRQRWPEAEKALALHDEILVTRDGEPVAKLVRYTKPKRPGPSFDPVAHLARLRKASGGKIYPDSSERISRSRDDRFGHMPK